jgi:hypothetical protein
MKRRWEENPIPLLSRNFKKAFFQKEALHNFLSLVRTSK